MSLPKTLRAIEITEAALQLCVRPMPTPLPHQVLVKVAAAGVNRPDVMQRLGVYPPPAGASDIPGLEISGTVVAVGAAVQHLRLGDQVCALVTGGGYAEYCLASAVLCLPIPIGWQLQEAASIPETFFTVWSNVFDRAQLKPHETLLVQGGSSGIGAAAIQLGKAFQATVICTAGSEAKCQYCLALGADAAINYKTQDFVAECLRLTQQQGVNVVLDMVGGDYFPKHIKCLAADGRLVQIAIQQGAKTELNLWTLMLKRLTLTGSTLRARDDTFK
ncbi:MAG: NAD(P)H-quinone oxidoreductase, partial [Methylococcaceae bacterium]|nr:NAD(P)H-quinone oxidoreductase [Methylococcaceae bacterium]